MPGQVLNSQSQRFVLNLLEYFANIDNSACQHCQKQISLLSPQERVAVALKISRATVYNIKTRIASGVIGTPNKKRIRPCPTTGITFTDKMVIKETIYNMYKAHEHITLQSLMEKLKKLEIASVGRTSLWRILRELGFRYKKEDSRRMLCEQPHVAALRRKFLKEYIEIKQHPEEKTFVYLDETWIFQKGGLKRCWQDDDIRSTKKGKNCEGRRFIVLNAGNKDGWIEGASLVFSSSSKSADYHDNMNGRLFKKWLLDKLIPNLKNPSVVVLDNAPYHSELVIKPPTSQSKKAEIVAYLQTNNVTLPSKATKRELLRTVKDKCTYEKRYIVDELLQSHGHRVLRLPPYHCQFNPIELVWSKCKQYYDNHIGKEGYTEDKIIEMWNESLLNIKEDLWRKCISHVEKNIWECWEKEKKTCVTVNPLIISLTDSDSEDDFD